MQWDCLPSFRLRVFFATEHFGRIHVAKVNVIRLNDSTIIWRKQYLLSEPYTVSIESICCWTEPNTPLYLRTCIGYRTSSWFMTARPPVGQKSSISFTQTFVEVKLQWNDNHRWISTPNNKKVFEWVNRRHGDTQKFHTNQRFIVGNLSLKTVVNKRYSLSFYLTFVQTSLLANRFIYYQKQLKSVLFRLVTLFTHTLNCFISVKHKCRHMNKRCEVFGCTMHIAHDNVRGEHRKC